MPQPYHVEIEKALQMGNATEHTHRSTLKTLLENLAPGTTATNEPRRIACGAPDYVITQPSGHGLLTIGYVEAKDVGKSLDEVERSDQMKRYLASLPNLILTDYLEFRWYVDGKRRDPIARLARVDKHGKLTLEAEGERAVTDLLHSFLSHAPQPISSPEDLARRMAHLTHMIREIIVEAYKLDQASELLRGWRKAFADVLIAELALPERTGEFADMFAQTLAYGLFSARVMQTGKDFTRGGAQHLIPKTNPLLRKFFTQISGPEMDDEPYAGFVDDLVALLAQSDMDAILAHFGQRTRQQDPVVHFYETFLAAYDPALRESRGVYYTPEPVVSYIVRSVDHILKTRFACVDGLADRARVPVTRKNEDGTTSTSQIPRVLILDPATGTGTFLYSVIDHIRQGFISRGNAGMWPGYVHEHLLPRLFGFELLMAPYAVAHFKLGLQLAGRDLPAEQRADWSYNPAESTERLGVYLTNALDVQSASLENVPLFTNWLAEEARAARRVKRDLPIMVVMGNPPYSGHSANKGAWIDGLLKGKLPDGTLVPSYYELDGKPLGERNSKWLQDDYVKFIRFGQWRIEQTGAGVLAFVTNHGYLDNPTFRGMRQQLMNAFTDIYILNLHGNSKKKETAPDGSADQNVFDIQQGVAIGIFVKEAKKSGPAHVHHADLYGVRKDKYPWLSEHEIANTQWTDLAPQSPLYLFVPQNIDLRAEYERGWSVTKAFPINVLGFQSHRDHFAVDFDRASLYQRIKDMRDETLTDMQFRQKYEVTDSRDWKLANARIKLRQNQDWQKDLIDCLYRPFDKVSCYFSDVAMDYPRRQLIDNVANKNNLCLNTSRQTKMSSWQHVLASDCPTPAVYVEIKDGSTVFPLYRYSTGEQQLFDTTPYPPAKDGRTPNVSPAFVNDMAARIGLAFISDGAGDLQTTFGPEDIFHYIYAVFHSPAYRDRYAEFLKIDFPRVPLTSDVALFRQLCGYGRELVGLHLMQTRASEISNYPVKGDNVVETGHPRYDEGTQRVYISKDNAKSGKRGQYFGGVPKAVWEFQVGGYQVLDKWLKDRKGRTLNDDDLVHYQAIVAALAETIRLMEAIDAAIEDHGGYPLDSTK